MVTELTVHAVANVVELLVQIFVLLQMISFLDSGLVTWLYGASKLSGKMTVFSAVSDFGKLRFSMAFRIVLQDTLIIYSEDSHYILTDASSNIAIR